MVDGNAVVILRICTVNAGERVDDRVTPPRLPVRQPEQRAATAAVIATVCAAAGIGRSVQSSGRVLRQPGLRTRAVATAAEVMNGFYLPVPPRCTQRKHGAASGTAAGQ